MNQTEKDIFPNYFLSLIKHIEKSTLIFNNQGEIVHVQQKESSFQISLPSTERCLLTDAFRFELAIEFKSLLEKLKIEKHSLSVLQLCDGKKTMVGYEQLSDAYHLLVFKNENLESNEILNIAPDHFALLEIILEYNPEAIQMHDKMGALVYMNRAARERLGLNADDYKQHTVFDFESYFQTPKDWEDELEYLRKNGKRTIEAVHKNLLTQKNHPVEVTVFYKELNGAPYTIATTKDISRRKQIENKLSETNRFLDVLNSAIDTSSLVSETDVFGNISYVNQKFCEVSGYTHEELIGQNHSIINSRLHSKEFWSDFWRTIKSNKTWAGEICNKAKDGSLYWVKTLIYPVCDENGEIASFLSVRQDITNEKQSRKKLENTVAFQELLLTISNRFVNIPLEHYEGALNDSLKELGKFFGVDRSYVFKYDHTLETCSNTHEWCRNGIAPQIDNLQSLTFAEISEWTAYHFNKELINFSDVEELPESQLKKSLQDQEIKSVLAIPMLFLDKCIGFIGFDAVTEKKHFYEQDVLILKLFAKILVNVQSRIKSINEITIAKEEIERINQNLEIEVFEKRRENSKLTNMLSEHEKLALLGEIAAGVAHDMNTPLGSIKVGIESIRFILENLFKSVIEKCTVHQMHFACQLAMTKEIQMVMGGLQVMKETTSILEYISSQFPSLSVDANSLAKAFVKARIKVDEEELIAQVIATENPLEYLDLIYHIQTIRNLVDTVIASGDKATAVVSNLRNYLQNSSSEERKQVNLRVNIETILTVFSHELKNKVDLQFKVPDIYVLGFENKLYQLWSNIIKNAIEAIEGQGELNIIYIEKPEYHSISIQNNGPKIDDEVLDNMFKKFYTTKGKQKGTGLGLSIVKRIINEHHGQVLVSSTNKLTTFEFLFPKNN